MLPKEAYTSKDWFELEKKHIFNRCWTYAGLVEDVDKPGDVITVQAGSYNIIVTRSENGALKAHHNICRHKGTQLLRSVGVSKKVFTCPYHDWTYNLDGELISVPEEKTEFPNLNKKKLCLHKAKVAVWRGIIWVHPDPKAQEITEWFAGIEENLGPHVPENLIDDPESASDDIINANWKIVVENYIDVYHLSHLHSNTLQMYDHKKSEFEFVGPHYTFWEPIASRYRKNFEDLLIAKPIEGYTDETLGAYVPFLFPTLGLAESETTWSVFQVIPLAPNKTRVITRTKYAESSPFEQFKYNIKSGRNWEKVFGNRTKYPDNSDESDPMNSGDFMAEDIFACEQQQQSFESPLFEVGASAENGEYPVRRFQEIVGEWMGQLV